MNLSASLEPLIIEVLSLAEFIFCLIFMAAMVLLHVVALMADVVGAKKLAKIICNKAGTRIS